MKNRFRKLIICLSLLSVLVCSMAVPSFAAQDVQLLLTESSGGTYFLPMFYLSGDPVTAYPNQYIITLEDSVWHLYVGETDFSSVGKNGNGLLMLYYNDSMTVRKYALVNDAWVLHGSSNFSSPYDVGYYNYFHDSSSTITMSSSTGSITSYVETKPYNPVPDASSLVTNATAWISSMAGLVMNNSLILAYALLPLLGVGIGLLVRAKNSNK